jgi:hypothetical protein
MPHYFYHVEGPEGHEVYRDQKMIAGPFADPARARAVEERLAKQQSVNAIFTVLPSDFDTSHIDSTCTISRACWKAPAE